MSIGENDIGGRIAARLDRGLADIDAHTLAQLRSARESALQHFQPQTAWALAPQRTVAGRSSGMLPFNLPRLASVAALIAVIAGMVYWQHLQHEDPVDIDAKLLAGDLPIDAYLDKGLDAWLNR